MKSNHICSPNIDLREGVNKIIIIFFKEMNHFDGNKDISFQDPLVQGGQFSNCLSQF